MSTKSQPKNIKYIVIGLLLGIVIGFGYYFLDYNPEQVIGVSKEKVLLADQAQYDLDIVLNSMISNQIVLQNSIKLLDERIILLEGKLKEQENDDNKSE